jgi:hypothetical protein
MFNQKNWAWEKDHGFDAENHQHKEACLALAQCPVCGKDVELIAETESWTADDEGRWVHDSYSPATGICCDKLIADWWEGCFVYDLVSHHHGETECAGCEDCDFGEGRRDGSGDHDGDEDDWREALNE